MNFLGGNLMLGVKILFYSFIFLVCLILGLLNSQKYVYRVEELQEFKNALNMFKTKIKFTYEPIPDIFEQISKNTNSNISNVFGVASDKMKVLDAGEAWNLALNMEELNINDEDRLALSNLSKLLGKTDVTGQLNHIELTTDFLEGQIKKAEQQRDKSEKMYRTLGMLIGMAIVIILM